MERKRSERGSSGLSSLEELDKWRNDNPVEIPDHIVEERAQAKAKSSSPDLSFTEFSALSADHSSRMQGTDDDSLLYQLEYLWTLDTVPGDGIQSQILQLEDSLRKCWCGSGIRTRHCHDKQ